ncbi:MAG: hypothetical protein HY663_06900 [Chloroflexi bacterium]|nr:hypothetical protein [Chloroflexota bacterium]
MGQSAAEYAIFVSKAKHFSYLDDPFALLPESPNAYRSWVNEIHQKMTNQVGRVKFTRLYFGQEFCQRLLPRVKDVVAAMEEASRRGMSFTLVTPYVTDEGLNKVKELLGFLTQRGGGYEVVFNDWGTLRLLKRENPDLVPVAGRLIDKMRRDPRFLQRDFEEFFTPQALAMLQRPNVDAATYRQLLDKYGVDRVELDPVTQGFDIDFKKLEVSASLYAPYGFVTFGRVCFIGALSYPRKDKFKIHYQCRKECQRYDQYMHKTLVPMPDAVAGTDRLGEIRLERKGTTVFFVNDRLNTVLKECNFDRVVYQPRVPM